MEYHPHIIPLEAQKKLQCDWKGGVLLRSTNWLGDLLMTLPAAWQLSRALPQGAHFAVLCPASLAPLWKATPWVTNVIGMAKARVSSTEIAQARSLNLGVGVIFPNSFGAAWDVRRCGIPRRIGRKGRFRSLLLTDTIREWPRATGAGEFHQLSWYLELVSALAPVEWKAEYPPLQIDTADAVALGMRPEERWLLLAPGAAYGPAKQWPMEHFLEIARRWATNGGRIVAVGSQKEANLTRTLAEGCSAVLDLGGKTTLSQLMGICRLARYAVCNDSGAMHLAAACGTRGTAVFGSTDPIATGPLGAPWRMVVSSAQCRPCFQRTCSCDKPYHCLREITPDLVWEEMQNDIL